MSLFTVLYLAKAIFVPVALAILASFMLSPVILFLQRLRIPRTVGAACILLVFCLFWGTLVNVLMEPFSVWMERLPSEFSQIEHKLSTFRDSLQNVQETTQRLNEMTSVDATPTQTREVVIRGPSILSTLLDTTQSFLLGVLSFVVMLYFMLAFGDVLLKHLAEMAESRESYKNFMRIAREVQYQVSYYLVLITGINVALGVAVGVAMWILNMPNPLLWAALAASLNYIPYVGASINLIIIAMVSLLTFNNVGQILLPPAVVLLINLIEGQFVQPLFVGRMFTLNPIIIFLFILLWGWVWGIAGIFIAVPLLMILKIVFDRSENFQQWGRLLAI